MVIDRLHTVLSSPIAGNECAAFVVETAGDNSFVSALPDLDASSRDQLTCCRLFFQLNGTVEHLLAVGRNRLVSRSGLLKKICRRQGRSGSALIYYEQPRDQNNR